MFGQNHQQAGLEPINTWPDKSLRGGPDETLTIDERLRLKLPPDLYNQFLQRNDQNPAVFITMIKNTHISLFPYLTWRELEVFLSVYLYDPVLGPLINRMYSYGKESTIASQGRITMPKKLAESVGIDVELAPKREVYVKGMMWSVDVIPEANFERYTIGINYKPKNDIERFEQQQEMAFDKLITEYNKLLLYKRLGKEAEFELPGTANLMSTNPEL
jgi:DNA-binding transcriptional regulator/RsmH inhibitor MraZ